MEPLVLLLQRHPGEADDGCGNSDHEHQAQGDPELGLCHRPASLAGRIAQAHAFNQRSIAGILEMIRMLGAMVDAGANGLVATLEARLAEAGSRAANDNALQP